MRPKVIIGTQWGDEGKGKIVDAVAGEFDVVGRFNGGNNAGHTVIYQGEQVKLHVLPSGVFQRKKLVIAQGAVFDPEVLITEIDFCKSYQIPLDLLIDYRVNLVMPYHKLLDGANETWKGGRATGSVKVGIGYCYEDRNNRSGIRAEDLLYPKILQQKIATIFPLKKAILEKVYGVKVDLTADQIYHRLFNISKYIKPYIGDVAEFMSVNIGKKRLLFEGAMATMLDGNFGTYPYTVANNTLAASLFTSLGIPETSLNVIGVVKSYTTRVGGGPFPTEQKNKSGETLQNIGKEIAATSGRIRRCGWLDLPVVRYAHRLNRFSQLAVTKLDVLSGFTQIPVCTGYNLNGKVIREYPAISHEFYKCKPIYQKLTGWKQPLIGITAYAHLPPEAKKYIAYIESEIGVPVKYISIGPEREALLLKN